MQNRVDYLKFLSENRNALMSDVTALREHMGDEGLNGKMNQLLLLSEDPKSYYQAA